ncbi:MAG: DEAD/DEAH box helicase [Candidatus Eisenbacteria bacterium]|uniref:RNA helicase n=1 Tax=Eiseniibacteriota bacterium TaxID=2212470 RepID=A0A956SDF9_UNCEI|nr:DEAD/DEAH box helicase [Candidatus Eisenbacteria bacterium]
MSFQDLGLRPEIARALEEIEYREPTPIQSKAIPLLLEGNDVMACAQTGTGKTAAFALPILHRLLEGEKNHLRALILVPTRELAIQVAKNINAYAAHAGITTTCAYGGVPIEPQEMMLRHGVDILVATPGRLIDHMWRGNIDYRHTEVLVLDEADRMLDMGFIKDVLEIVREIPTDRQSMLFSATLGPDITRLSKQLLKEPVRIEVAPPASTVDKVEQFIIRVNRDEKAGVLEDLIRQHDMRRSIVFTKTKVGASRLASHLRRRGIQAEAIHSNRSQEERVRTLEAFRGGTIHVLVATDIAARGIDVDEITHVVNYDVPYAAEDYVHRIGRTARAGRTGMAIMLVTKEEMRGVRSIERLIGFSLPEEGGELVPLSAGERGSEPSRRSASRRGGGGRRERGGAGRRGASRGGRSGGGDRHSRQDEGVAAGASFGESRATGETRNGAAPGGPKKRRRRKPRSGGPGEPARGARTQRDQETRNDRPNPSDRDRNGKKEKRSIVQTLLGKLGFGD